MELFKDEQRTLDTLHTDCLDDRSYFRTPNDITPRIPLSLLYKDTIYRQDSLHAKFMLFTLEEFHRKRKALWLRCSLMYEDTIHYQNNLYIKFQEYAIHLWKIPSC
ncbi:hypothetical protein EVAR_51692_1 [Eumeta japonica]|uniref:Uncharacterized protein n=1 Tax=Eumeta variegata TaxID=151549 RepID=A0A4C1Y722_EUMVA|nr:hypothetical protein EVAR_51692_1 [Eumeta japonica]